MTERTRKQLKLIKDIYIVSEKLRLKTFFWGGFAVDILHGAFTRDHSDIDAFIEKMTFMQRSTPSKISMVLHIGIMQTLKEQYFSPMNGLTKKQPIFMVHVHILAVQSWLIC